MAGVTRSYSCAAFVFLLAALFWTASESASASASNQPIPGGWVKIANVSDPQVQEIGKFAITEHNREIHQALVYVRVISGETQVVAGTNYKLLIRARTGHGLSTYQAIVWDQPWTKLRVLSQFIQVA